MANEKSIASTGATFSSILFLVFLVLKLCHLADISWWLVFAPIWFPAGIALVGFIIWLIYIIIYKK